MNEIIVNGVICVQCVTGYVLALVHHRKTHSTQQTNTKSIEQADKHSSDELKILFQQIRSE